MFDILVDSRSDQKTMHFLERKKKRNRCVLLYLSSAGLIEAQARAKHPVRSITKPRDYRLATSCGYRATATSNFRDRNYYRDRFKFGRTSLMIDVASINERHSRNGENAGVGENDATRHHEYAAVAYLEHQQCDVSKLNPRRKFSNESTCNENK